MPRPRHPVLVVRSPEQARDALKAANARRSALSALKAKVRTDPSWSTLYSLVLGKHEDENADRLRVNELLEAVPRLGPVKVRRAFRAIGRAHVEPDLRLGQLSREERYELWLYLGRIRARHDDAAMARATRRFGAAAATVLAALALAGPAAAGLSERPEVRTVTAAPPPELAAAVDRGEAIARNYWLRTIGRTVECDVTWTYLASVPAGWQRGSAWAETPSTLDQTGCAGWINLGRHWDAEGACHVVVHELGHMLGLAHDDPNPTMHEGNMPFLAECRNSRALRERVRMPRRDYRLRYWTKARAR
jgi:hypothetical protein